MFNYRYLLMTLIVTLCSSLHAENRDEIWTGKVIAVKNGDTFIVRKEDNSRAKIRLAEISAPKQGCPWSSKAIHALRELIGDKEVQVQVKNLAKLQSQVSTVWIGDTEVNTWLVENGHAWAHRKFMRRNELLIAETAARREGRGLWGLPENQRLDIFLW